MFAHLNRWCKIGLLSCFFFSFKVWGQYALTVKYFGLTIHPFGDTYAYLQPYRLDKNAFFVANIGLFVGAEKFLKNPNYSIKVIQGGFSDCSAGWAGLSHVGFRAKILEKGKHVYRIGLGPVFLYRESWTRFGEKYGGSSFFKLYNSRNLGMVQYKLIWYGVDMEYDYILNESNALSVSVTPGFPMAMIFSVGWKGVFGEMKEDAHKRIYIPRK